jgi:L-ascorbate metabolism protein UlaG (beta-lactamase superfamily)
MIKPFQQDEAFLADVARTRGDTSEHFRMWWLGQSGFLVQWQGRHLLFDPYLSDSLTKKYAGTPKPHVRMTERVVAPERLDFLDVVTSTHNHTDHLDAETLLPLRSANPNLHMVLPEANRMFAAERLGTDPAWPVGLNDGVVRRVGEFEFTGVPASHPELTRDGRGQFVYLGYVVKFGRWTIYHSGDGLRYDGMIDRLKPHNIDLAILPINGKVDNMNGQTAAEIAHELGAKVVIPCHYEMFEFNTADPSEQFVPTCEKLGQRYHLLRAGERFDSVQISAADKTRGNQPETR